MAVASQRFAATREELVRFPHPPVALHVDGVDYYRHDHPSGCGHTYLSADPFSSSAPEHDCP